MRSLDTAQRQSERTSGKADRQHRLRGITPVPVGTPKGISGRRKEGSQLTNDSTLDLASVVVIAAMLAIYFLPTMIAYTRQHERREAVLLVDLFLGCTFVGWWFAFDLGNCRQAREGRALLRAKRAAPLIGLGCRYSPLPIQFPQRRVKNGSPWGRHCFLEMARPPRPVVGL